MGNATIDTICTACPDNSFKAVAGSGACVAHKVCSVGETGVGATAGTKTADRECVACVAGSTFKSTIGDEACKLCSAQHSSSQVCPTGALFEQKCTPTTDLVCPEYAAEGLALNIASFGTPAPSPEI